MTEDKAKERWCPMVRHIADVTGDALMTNRAEHPDYVNCIATDCMMWRTTTQQVVGKHGTTWEKRGYCGLAGKYED